MHSVIASHYNSCCAFEQLSVALKGSHGEMLPGMRCKKVACLVKGEADMAVG